MIIESRALARTPLNGVALAASAASSAIKIDCGGFSTLRLSRSATGNVTLDVYGPKADGTQGNQLVTTIAAGNNDFTDPVDVRGLEAVWVVATDASAAANTVTVEAFLGS